MMPQAKIMFKLDGGETVQGMRVYRPGDVASGTFALEPQTDIRCRSIQVRLGWHTEGKGDRDAVVVAHTDIEAKEVLRQGTLLQGDFSFQLPPWPWSYGGHLVNIIWEVWLQVDVPMGRDVIHTAQFILTPAWLD
jgi:hypothetical protein